MLLKRVLTAAVLLVLLLLALTVAQPWGFTALALFLVAAATWEWMALVGVGPTAAIFLAIANAALMWGVSTLLDDVPSGVDAALWVDAAAWILLAATLVVRRHFPDVKANRALYVVAGIALPGVCWIALMAAYTEGLIFMVSILAIVWVADIAAYFSGKAFGRHKLAPTISPGKTVEGAVGALIAVWAVSWASCFAPLLHTSFVSRMAARQPWWLCGLVLALMVGMSIVGDLFESHLKRQSGVKDSSHLLPGHGGVLDRLDAVLPVVPVAMLISRLW